MRNALFAAALTLTACSDMRSWAYTPEPRQTGPALIAETCVVPPFVDRRANENTNMAAMYMIPLVPYGWADYQTPEGTPAHFTSMGWKFSPADDLARAIAQEIDAARIFEETFTDSRRSAAPWALTGEIVSTRYELQLYSYCLSIFGPTLWFFGLPAGETKNTLQIRLALSRPGAGDPSWTYVLSADDAETHYLYSMGTDFRYDQLLRSQMPNLIESLRAAVRNLPAR